MKLFDRINYFNSENNLIHKDQTVIVGFSGGPDSRLLLEWLLSFTRKEKIILAYLNHQWRIEADKEEEYCRVLAQDLGIAYHSSLLDHYKKDIEYNGSKEDFARSARRKFLEELAKKYNACIALGHHQDDQIETFFIRLIRGSTVTGLGGMLAKKGLYIRPLLAIRKHEIIQELDQRNITYCIDSSNESDNFLRNKIRLSLIPTLLAIDSRSKTNVMKAIHSLQLSEKSLENYTKTILQEIIESDNGMIAINKKKFFEHELHIQNRIVKELLIRHKIEVIITDNLLKECIRFLLNKAKSHDLSRTIKILQTEKYFWILKK